MICCLNGYEYGYGTANKLAKRYSYYQYMMCTIECLNTILFDQMNSEIHIFFIIAMNLLSCLDIVYELPYFDRRVQRLNMFGCIFNLLCSIVFIIGMHFEKGEDHSILLAIICLLPISIKITSLFYTYFINKAENTILNCIDNDNIPHFNPNYIDIYLRKLYDMCKLNFKFNHIFNDPQTCIILSAIISAAQQDEDIKNEKDEYIGLEKQTEVIIEFFRDLYKKIVRERQKIDKKANIKYCYMSFLIQVYKKRTITYLEILNEKNDTSREKSLRESQSLYAILQEAEESFKYEAFMNDHINVLQIIDYDRELNKNQTFLEECIRDKKQLLNSMSLIKLDLNRFQVDARNLILKREDLKQKIKYNCKINDDNQMLKEQVHHFVYYLSMGDTRLSNFFKHSLNKNKFNRSVTSHKSNTPQIHMYKSNRFSIVFITLIKNIGQITGASNNLSTLFDYQKDEIIGKNINIFIPSNISSRHQFILNNFSKRGSNNHCFQNFRFILGQNKKGFILPLMLKLKIDIIGKDDFGISGIFRRVNEKQHYMMISENFKISGISENMFKDIFSQHFSLSEVQQFNINKLIPLFMGTITIKLEEDEAYGGVGEDIFESYLIVNYSRQAHHTLHQKTYTIEKDVQEIDLTTSNIYRIVFKVQSHFSYGFRYYNLIINHYDKINFTPQDYSEAASLLVQQLDEVYSTPRQILLNLMDQCLLIQDENLLSIDKMLTKGLQQQTSIVVTNIQQSQSRISQNVNRDSFQNILDTNHVVKPHLHKTNSIIQQTKLYNADEIQDNIPSNTNITNQFQKEQKNEETKSSTEQKPKSNDINQIFSETPKPPISLHQKRQENNQILHSSINNGQVNVTHNIQQINNQSQIVENEDEEEEEETSIVNQNNATDLKQSINKPKTLEEINNTGIDNPLRVNQDNKSIKKLVQQNTNKEEQGSTIFSSKNNSVLQKINETKQALQASDQLQQQTISAGSRLQMIAQKLRFNLRGLKSQQPSTNGSQLSPQKIIQLMKKKSLNQMDQEHYKSPEIETRRKEFKRIKQRKGLIRIITSRMKDSKQQQQDSPSDSSSNESNAKNYNQKIGQNGIDNRNNSHKISMISLKRKTNSRDEQENPSQYTSSPLSTFRIGRQRQTMIKNIQGLLSQQYNNDKQKQPNDDDNYVEVSNKQQNQNDNNDDDAQMGASIEDRKNHFIAFSEVNQKKRENSYVGLDKVDSPEQIISNPNIQGMLWSPHYIDAQKTLLKLDINSQNQLQNGDNVLFQPQNKINSLENIQRSQISLGNETQRSKKGSTLKYSKNIGQNKHQINYQSTKQQMSQQQQNANYDVFDYDFSSTSSSGSEDQNEQKVRSNKQNIETSKFIQQQQTDNNIQTYQIINQDTQIGSKLLPTTKNLLATQNFLGDINQLNSANFIDKFQNELKNVNGQQRIGQNKKNKNKQKLDPQLDEEEGTSSQSEQRRRNIIIKKLIMHQIKSKKKDFIISAIQILGFIVLIAIAIGTLVIYFDFSSNFEKMENNLEFIGWPMSIKSQLLLVIKGECLLRYLNKNIFGYNPVMINLYKVVAQQQIQDNYDKLQRYLIQQSKKDIEQYKIFNDIITKQLTFELINSSQNIEMDFVTNLSYNINMLNSFLYRVSQNLENKENEQSNIFVNYFQTLDALDEVSTHTMTNQQEIRQYLDGQLNFGLFAMIIVTLIFATSVFPLFAVISSYSQKALKIFSTFSPELLAQMHNHLNSFSKHSKSSSRSINLQQKTMILFESSQIEKKRNQSQTTNLPRIKKMHLVFSIIFFLIIIIYPVLNFIMCSQFIQEQYQNLNLLEKLFYVKSLSIENIELNYLISYKKMMPLEYPNLNVTLFQQRGSMLMLYNNQAMEDLQSILKKQHQITRKNEQQFEGFVMNILEGNACEVIKNNTEYFDPGEVVTYEECLAARKNMFTKGVLLTLGDVFNLIPIVSQLYKINDPILYRKMLTAAQTQTSIIELDNFNVVLSRFIDTCKNFIIHLSRDYYNYISTVQLILVSYQVILLFLVFYFGWVSFCASLQLQLFSSKQLFSLFHISFLIDNPYFYSYFSSRKFKI